jgi:hypothetical protein
LRLDSNGVARMEVAAHLGHDVVRALPEHLQVRVVAEGGYGGDGERGRCGRAVMRAQATGATSALPGKCVGARLRRQ